jgi:hypothetical protein
MQMLFEGHAPLAHPDVQTLLAGEVLSCVLVESQGILEGCLGPFPLTFYMSHPFNQTFKVGQRVSVIQSNHSGISGGAVGVVESIEEDARGYAVWFPVVARQHYSGYAYHDEATIFIWEDWIEPYQKGENPMPYKLKPDEKQTSLLVNEMHRQALSVSLAADLLFGDHNPLDQVRAEAMLDHLWDKGICICLGEYYEYKYILTEKGKRLL